MSKPKQREIQWLTISGGKQIPAYKAVCPKCNVLDMNMRFSTTQDSITGICSKGHEWPIVLEEA